MGENLPRAPLYVPRPRSCAYMLNSSLAERQFFVLKDAGSIPVFATDSTASFRGTLQLTGSGVSRQA